MFLSKRAPSFIAFSLGLGFIGYSGAVAAQAAASAPAAQPSAAFQQRAEQLVALINGTAQPADLFAPEALTKVPAERLMELAASVRERRGEALGVARIEAEAANKGTVYIDFSQSQVALRIRVQEQAPYLIDGLMFQ